MIAAASATTTDLIALEKWWQNADSMFRQVARMDASFESTVESMPSELFDPVWQRCGGLSGLEGLYIMDGEELIECDQVFQQTFGMFHKNVAFDFFGRFWEVIDLDSDGGLAFDEFKRALVALAATNARTTLDAFDSSGNGWIDGDEIMSFQDFFAQEMNKEGPVSPEQVEAIGAAFSNMANAEGRGFGVVELSMLEIEVENVMLTL